ncbi:MAG: hypothetical protein KBC83_02780 [Candidatus Moranbacteria bacterium]|jgi:hypothetical protein|nr:hypothetical protein [Candidatus Moranbacteria bacterium]MBP9801563.1 hypothetical protein [Candidatus Moranbacteria bacterium]
MNESPNRDEDDPLFEETSSNEVGTWLQENLRVIVSVFIVGAIALGIYSYSQRTETVSTDDVDSEISETTTDSTDTSASDDTDASMEEKKTTPEVPTEMSRETEDSFVETAVAGEGSTHLARRALANSLEKDPDSSLTSEHKIYIEDYLRKHVEQKQIHAGTSIEFSKSLINEAISKSKTLNGHQLDNLKKYSARVTAYR